MAFQNATDIPKINQQHQDWVFEEVLPKLRADGYYMARRDAETISKQQAEIDSIKCELDGERQEREYLEIVNADLKQQTFLFDNYSKKN